MRGRTNLLGFNEDFINAYIDQYEVKENNSVVAGDFVELFSQTDAMSIVDGAGKELTTDFVKIANSYYVAGLKTQIYLFKIVNEEIRFVNNFSIPQEIDVSGDIISICYDSGYIYVTKGQEALYKKLYAYKFDSVNEELTYIANTTIHGGYLTLLDDGVFINTQKQERTGNAANAEVDKIYNSVVSISVDETNGTVSTSNLYLDPANEMFPSSGTSYKYYKYRSKSCVAISPDGTKIIIESSASTTTNSSQTITEFLQQRAAFSYDRTNRTFSKIGSIASAGKSFYGFGLLSFIDNRYCMMVINSYYNMDYCPSITFIDFNTLTCIDDSIFYPEFKLNNVTLAEQQVRFKVLMMKDRNVILTSPVVYDNDSSDYVFLFVGVGLNELLDIVYENNVYAIDFESDASTSSQRQTLLERMRSGKILYDEESLKYNYVFPTFNTPSANPHNIMSNELDVSNLPYAEMTSDKPKKVAAYTGKINGVAKTSGNAGEVIDVYVPY